MREAIRAEIASIEPFDEREARTRREVLTWVDSGEELCRIEKPDTPPRHLVSYFVLIDGDYLLLVDHINAQLWLPTGGHVEPDEHPQVTALREAKEELGIDGEFVEAKPYLVTSTETVGLTQGHTDVSIWYALKGDRNAAMTFDDREFKAVRWFHKTEVPLDKSDPELGRFIEKFYADQL